ncbi:hypothetical protein [Shewanella baltica]|uniref:hypothetical protein n=1 Tax=Shewanella baltica TaxID=62322 RepID=UPI0039AF52EC
MIKPSKHEIVNNSLFNQSLVSIDADIDTERVIIMARDSGEVFHNFTVQLNKQVKFIVPLIYNLNENLLVGILDDNRIYNAKFIDGVQAELINGNEVITRP